MKTITDVIILDNHTLQLKEDAKALDIIDLSKINNIDLSVIIEKINQGKDQVYKQKLEDFKAQISKEHMASIDAAIKEKENIIKQLKIEKEHLDEIYQQKIKSTVEETKNQNVIEIQNLKEKILKLQFEKNSEVMNIKNRYDSEIQNLKQKLDHEKEINEITKKAEIENIKYDYENKLKEQEDMIRNLQLSKSALNVKRIGEELEQWCFNEFQHYALSGFENASFEKDNIAVKAEGDIKGTKGDYIFKLFADSSKDESKLLTSALLEMKSEDPNSKNKTKNSDHFKKLDKDRNNKNLEYALLISELEWDQPNDAPIKKVMEYEKMYIIRPQYFISFLSVISNLALKYQSLILEKQEETIKFKDSYDILMEFEAFKEDIISNVIEHVKNHIQTIQNESRKIEVSTSKILNASNLILETYMHRLKNKIDGFQIQRQVNKINKLEG